VDNAKDVQFSCVEPVDHDMRSKRVNADRRFEFAVFTRDFRAFCQEIEQAIKVLKVGARLSSSPKLDTVPVHRINVGSRRSLDDDLPCHRRSRSARNVCISKGCDGPEANASSISP